MKLGGIKIQVLMAAALLGLSGLRAAASTMNDSHNELAEAIDTFVEQAHRELSFHGNVEVRLAGDVIYKRSLGLANAEFDVPHSERSRFMIASVSKQFTAAMILKLQELGKLDIHKPLSTYIEPQANSFHPDTLEGWRQVTLHQLMSHTAGAMRDVRFTEYYSNQTYEPFLSTIVIDIAINYNLFPGEIGQQARRCELVLPGVQLTLRVQGASKPVQACGTIEVPAHVVFAEPDELDRAPELSGDVCGLYRDVGIDPAPEAAPDGGRVHPNRTSIQV